MKKKGKRRKERNIIVKKRGKYGERSRGRV